MSKKTKDQDYLFISAMLRARESQMLTSEKMVRMLDATSYSEAARVLTECGFEDVSDKSTQELEEVFSKHRAEIFKELSRMCPEKEIVDAFRLKYDYHNAKVLIKSESADVDGLYLMSDCGRVDPKKFAEAYHAQEYRFLPNKLSKAVEEARGVIQRTENPQLADFILDRAYFEELREMADRVTSPFLSGYVTLLIDGANLNSIVRTARIGRDIDFLKKALFKGGSVNAERVGEMALAKEPFALMYAGTEYADCAQLGEAAANGGKLANFEQSCKMVQEEYFSKAVFVSFGAETVVAYIAAVEEEIKAARMILTGKLSGVNPKIIRERLCLSNA